jgi:hypothetical protein
MLTPAPGHGAVHARHDRTAQLRQDLDSLMELGDQTVDARRPFREFASLNKDAPLQRALERLGAVVSRPVLGGLHHKYCRI